MRTKVTIHNAQTGWGKLAHWWTIGSALSTDCGKPCAYNDGPTTKLATGWVQAPPEAVSCPDCNMPSGL